VILGKGDFSYLAAIRQRGRKGSGGGGTTSSEAACFARRPLTLVRNATRGKHPPPPPPPPTPNRICELPRRGGLDSFYSLSFPMRGERSVGVSVPAWISLRNGSFGYSMYHKKSGRELWPIVTTPGKISFNNPSPEKKEGEGRNDSGLAWGGGKNQWRFIAAGHARSVEAVRVFADYNRWTQKKKKRKSLSTSKKRKRSRVVD